MLIFRDCFMNAQEVVHYYRAHLLCFRVAVALVNGVAARRLSRDLTEVKNHVFAMAAISSPMPQEGLS